MDKTTLNIIKIGGNVVDNEPALHRFVKDFASLPGHKILVHGGGKVATQLAQTLGIEVKMADGRRITDEKMLDVAVMVYAGLINKKITALLQAQSCNAMGLSGADANILPAHKRNHPEIDFGFVGDIEEDKINAAALQHFINSGLTPIVAPITHNGAGQLLNTNADTIASALAVGLSSLYEVNLVYCFEKNGVLKDVNDDNSVISTITGEDYTALKAQGIINKGMLPKLDNAFAALAKGVKNVIIGHANQLPLLVNPLQHAGTTIRQ